jgi:hypothetical protein
VESTEYDNKLFLFFQGLLMHVLGSKVLFEACEMINVNFESHIVEYACCLALIILKIETSNMILMI